MTPQQRRALEIGCDALEEALGLLEQPDTPERREKVKRVAEDALNKMRLVVPKVMADAEDNPIPLDEALRVLTGKQ